MKEYGCKKENTYETKVNIQVSTNRKQKDLIEENYNNKKNKILEIIKTWQKRDLTLYGKLTIIKSLIIPQGLKKSTSPTPGANNFHIWASCNNQLVCATG